MKKFLSLPYFIFSFIILAVLMVSSALLELHQSKKELLELMEENAHAILDGAIYGSIYNIRSGRLLEGEVMDRLFDNAGLIEKLQDHKVLNQTTMRAILDENNLLQIIVMDRHHKISKAVYQKEMLPYPVIPPAADFSSTDTFPVEKIVVHQFGDVKIFTAIYELADRGFIIVSIDGKILLDFRKKAGIGKLISEIATNKNVVYLAVQDMEGILAAKNIDSLNAIRNDPALMQILKSDSVMTRETTYNGQSILEVIHSFQISDDSRALFRMGLSLTPLENINVRIMRRIIIITAVLIILGLLLFTVLNIRQQYDLVNRQFGVVQTYFRKVVDSIKEGIITLDDGGKIQTINPAAEIILETTDNKQQTQILNGTLLTLDGDENIAYGEQEGYFDIQGKRKYLHLSVTEIEGEEKQKLIVIRDQTEKLYLEEQLRQKDRLTAMGQLASGVAHEVRNPLNAISTIIQQFDMDFEPVDNGDEYHSLAKLVIKEVKRINEIITRFVNFARPPKLNLQLCDLTLFISEVNELAKKSGGEKQIEFTVDMQSDITPGFPVQWDCDQMKQVMINLYKNAIDAIESNGKIALRVQKNDRQIILQLRDNGKGIREEDMKKIFNLYYTTKAEGTGFGLSDVHRIISLHGGKIEVDSVYGQGSEFALFLPMEVSSE